MAVAKNLVSGRGASVPVTDAWFVRGSREVGVEVRLAGVLAVFGGETRGPQGRELRSTQGAEITP